MDAAGRAFAERMRAKPIPESMLGGIEARIFNDPPEWIQMAFGGRAWFHGTDCRAVHRIGLLCGLGWRLGEYVRKQLGGRHAETNGVRVTARTTGYGVTEQLYDIQFVRYHQAAPEGQEPDNLEPVAYQIVEARGPLTAVQLKPIYAEVLGEHAV